MDFEKYTDRARGFIQSAQSLALREGHHQFSTEHLLKVLLDDPEGLAAGLIDRSGGRSREALAAVEAMQAAELLFATAIGAVFLHEALPGALAAMGAAAIVVGIALFAWASSRETPPGDEAGGDRGA